MQKRQFKIALMRELAGYNQQEAADALGIKKARYGDWERETREINLRDAIRLADLFECSLDDLAGHKVPNQHSITPDEMTLVDGYRYADDGQRFMMLATAQAIIDKANADADEKKASA